MNSESHVNVWTGPSVGPRALAGGNLLLAFLASSGTALAQEAPGGLGAHTGALMGAFWVLLGLLVALIAWEMVDRRSAAPPLLPAPAPATEGSPAAGEEAPVSLEEEDPFKALLRKTSAAEKEPAEQGAAGPLEEPSLTRPAGVTALTRMPEPAPSERAEEVEELSPFQRLAQIGSEETAPVPSLLPESRLEVPSPVPAPASGGDWAALLSKVQAEEEPPAPPARVSRKAAEEDPWKKLLGQTTPAEPPGAPKAEVEEDPWKALLSKASPSLKPRPRPSLPAGSPPGLRLLLPGFSWARPRPLPSRLQPRRHPSILRRGAHEPSPSSSSVRRGGPSLPPLRRKKSRPPVYPGGFGTCRSPKATS